MNAADAFFVDTNVLLYAADLSEPQKQEQARQWLAELWQNGSGRLSWQVLHEFYVNAIRKIGQPSSEARATVEIFSAWRPVDTSLGLMQRAWEWSDQAQVAYWDALILAAAERAGCRWLLSEDFQSGRRYGAVTVVNPFESGPAQFSR